MEIDGGTDESIGIETEYETVVEEVASEEEVSETAEPEAPTDEASDA
jgi:hypothetical protein